MMASFLDMLLSGGDYRMTAAEAGYPDRYGDGLLSRNRDRVPASVEAMQTGQDFVPGFGDALALAEAYDAASRGELAAAGLLGTGAVIGLVPGAGDAISRPVIAAGRNAMDLARRIEVDPSALGSMGGNIRLRPEATSDPSLPTPRNEAEAMAQKVLEMLKAGRADDITDDMIAAADDPYLFNNYDLPMDEASRMARKQEIGHDKDFFHGGKGGHSYLSADEGTGKTSGTGAFLSPSNFLAETYSPVVDGAVYPVSSRSSAPIVNADMQNWNNIEAPVYAYDPRTMEDIEVIADYGRASTDDIARNARGMAESIEIQDVSDRGPRAWGMTQYPAISDVRVEYDPRNLRSRFARFDPRLSHLRNLSAGVGGLGLLSSANFDEDYN